MCQEILFGESVKGKGGFALFGLRVVAGLAFIQHGWPLFQHAFTWMGANSQVPGFLQALAAFSEFCGGMALVAGLLTRLAALGLWCVMSYALFLVHIPHGDPFVSPTGGASYELAAVYWVIMLALMLRGGGLFSLDGLFSKKR
ncbi:MAG: DoxX family protein [Candidatus Omnitrophica bacterium]|nr:DoxX family protein [Candidatus Omnitrophota bacterium]